MHGWECISTYMHWHKVFTYLQSWIFRSNNIQYDNPMIQMFCAVLWCCTPEVLMLQLLCLYAHGNMYMQIAGLHIKISSPVSLSFITFFLLMDSLQKWLEAKKVFHRNINWIERDTLFHRGLEGVHERYLKSGYRERQSGGVFKEILDTPKIQKSLKHTKVLLYLSLPE